MAQAEPRAVREALPAECVLGGATIADSITANGHHSTGFRHAVLALAVAGGIVAAAIVSLGTSSILTLLCIVAFAGGLLSTWSPCGYSSLSLLRIDPPQDLTAVLRWLPTMATHAIGYAAGGTLLALALAGIGWLLPVSGFTPMALAGLAIVALLYGLHQLDLIRMPYPQLRLQVSHGARMDLPKWATGFLYGGHLGLNFATYVRTPILYVLVLACVLSGSLLTSIAIVASLNLGRFVPLLVNLLPVPDWSIQRWMAEHDRAAIATDGSILVFLGSLLLASVAANAF